MVQDEDSLMSEGKRKKRQAMQKQSLTTSQKQNDAQPVSEEWLLWKIFFFVMLNMTLYVWDIPGQLGTAFLVVAPPRLSPSQPAGDSGMVMWWAVRNRESLDAVQHCSAIAKPLVCSQHSFSHRFKTKLHVGCYEKS